MRNLDDEKEVHMKVAIFIPAYNVEKTLPSLIEEFEDLEQILRLRGHSLDVLIINDCSSDNTGKVLEQGAEKHLWLQVRHNTENLGNARNIISGYAWSVDSDVDVVGCMDADGEHSPYAMIRHLKMMENNECDGVVGSIIFPDHNSPSYHDRNMMRFLGGMQSEIAGIDGMFYIQAPGYNLHQRHRVAQALELFEKYKEFFAQNTDKELPRWGLHAVMIHLISVGTGGRIKAVYLECFGQSPNRTPEKLMLQSDAANTHVVLLSKFMPKI